MIAILSGRYEIVHPGHIKTIRREAALADLLFVMVVDNPESATPSECAAEMINFCVQDLNNVHVLLDTAHFGRCTKEDIDRLPPFDVFLSANDMVTHHLRGLGVNVREIQPTPGYSSTVIRERIISEYHIHQNTSSHGQNNEVRKMMHRKSMNPSKATKYRGNGKTSVQAGGCMFERDKTEEEKAIEARIRARYSEAFGEFYIAAGTNMGKPLFLMQLRGGYDIESTISMEDLEKEVEKFYNSHKESGIVI